uniref:Nucleosome assembly protein n=1 Tax=Bursaphelenchus xylophilus TaxID=6326 RepID=A0A1I7SVJ5_BURXY
MDDKTAPPPSYRVNLFVITGHNHLHGALGHNGLRTSELRPTGRQNQTASGEDSTQLRKKLEDIQEALTSAVQEYVEELQTKRDQIEASPDKEDGKAQLEEKLEGSGTKKSYDAVKAAKEWIATFDSVETELVLLEATLTREAAEVLARPLPRPSRATAAKLPKLTLQTFDGADTLAYLPFMDSFTVHVDSAKQAAISTEPQPSSPPQIKLDWLQRRLVSASPVRLAASVVRHFGSRDSSLDRTEHDSKQLISSDEEHEVELYDGSLEDIPMDEDGDCWMEDAWDSGEYFQIVGNTIQCANPQEGPATG